jgi:hypothetical protein
MLAIRQVIQRSWCAGTIGEKQGENSVNAAEKLRSYKWDVGRLARRATTPRFVRSKNTKATNVH